MAPCYSRAPPSLVTGCAFVCAYVHVCVREWAEAASNCEETSSKDRKEVATSSAGSSRSH